jgi:hypothetical protein
MKRPFVEEYKGYSLKCAPQETHDGRFLAFLIISHGGGQVCPDSAGLLPDLPSFGTEEDAAVASLAAALRWVDDAMSPQPHSRRASDVTILAPRVSRRSIEYWATRTSGFNRSEDARYLQREHVLTDGRT